MIRIGRLVCVVLAISAICIVSACSNDMRDILELSQFERAPAISADSLHLAYTEKGILSATVSTSRMISYDRELQKYDEFPQGIEVKSYDSAGNIKSLIRANYALYQRDIKLWDARYNVVAVNENGDSIQSEQIFWNEETRRVYTSANVRVRTANTTLFGRGFESDDRFESWEIKEPTGVITVPRPQQSQSKDSDTQDIRISPN